MDSLDRLSDLPEGLLCEILSRMETQHAVRTCVLSKRWTRLWTQLALINLKLDSFDNVDSFQHFLLGLFTHYDASKLYSLRFQYTDVDLIDDMDGRLVETIVDYATFNRVVHLSIDCFISWKSIRLPSQLLACLDGLTLERMTIEFPVRFYSASLLSISLEAVNIHNDISFNCVNLESFYMVDCSVCGLTEILIDAPKLVNLHIDLEWIYKTSKKTMVLISAPRLESILISFDCDSKLNISLDRCPSLESAWIDMHRDLSTKNAEPLLERRTCANHLVNFLKDVSVARSLTFSAATMKVLSEFPELVKNEPSPFHNLKSLSVFGDNRVQSVVIPPEVEMFLVGASPNGSELFEGLLSELEKYYH